MKLAALNKLSHLVVLLGVSVSVTSAWAVGGPPLVTDDPDTPGDGHWEINLAAIAQRTGGGNTIAAPDADINYGLGDFIQLKADLPYTYAQLSGQPSKSASMCSARFISSEARRARRSATARAAAKASLRVRGRPAASSRFRRSPGAS